MLQYVTLEIFLTHEKYMLAKQLHLTKQFLLTPEWMEDWLVELLWLLSIAVDSDFSGKIHLQNKYCGLLG
jgi:hypothetical protein